MSGKASRLCERCESADELQVTSVEGCLEAIEEQAAIQPREHPHRKEEAGSASDPASIGCQATAWHKAMNMRMMAPTPTIP